MTPVFLRPGEQLKGFTLHRETQSVGSFGRVSGDAAETIVQFQGSLSQTSQREQEKWSQLGHPVSHTVVARGRIDAQASDELETSDRRFTVQAVDDPGGLGMFTVLYCLERVGVYDAGTSG